MKIFKKKHVDDSALPLGDELSFAAHEAYRLLRTNVIFSFAGESKCRVVGISSTVKGEGKTTTAINLAYVLAENNARVCLIEADMRMPTVGKRLKLQAANGLSELLTGQISVDESIKEKTFEKCKFNVITAGRIPPNPAELLSSSKMAELLEELRGKFDFVVIDFPPVDVVADTLIVGILLDGLLLAVGQGIAKKKQLHGVMRQLSMTSIRVLGFVRTFTTISGFSYSKKYKYKSYYGNYRSSSSNSSNNN